jgi:hypothetical protein
VNEELVFDAWTPISFKRAMGSRSATGAGAGFTAPRWVGQEHERRVTAYAVLRSYLDNAAREFMYSQNRDEIDNRREYGDAALLVNTVLGALLGEDQAIVTEGAEDAEAQQDAEDGDAAERAGAAQALALQDWLRQWAQDERLGLKMIEAERRAVGLGDGVYSLGWSAQKGRPRLRVWDPTFYFPVLSDGNEDDFPDKVHIAWEEEVPQGPGSAKPNVVIVRRITWEMGFIAPVTGEDGSPVMLADGRAALLEGDSLDAEGRIVRQYPWNDEPSPYTCYLTDATWELNKAGGLSVDELTEGTARYAMDDDGLVRRRDIGVDFIPVVHLPNTVSLIDHFGRSTLASVLQLLDDLASADTDLSAAAATTGHPVIALQGGRVDRDSSGNAKVTYRPGEILESGDGKLDMLDTSKALDALIGYIEFLLKRLSVNSRVAESLLGRVKPSEVPSGVALALSFGPTEQLVKEMRLVRAEKYPLLLKFAHRMALAGAADAGVPAEWTHTGVVMGSFLPQDQAEAVSLVTKLLAATPRPAISLETAVSMLVEAGLPIRDAFAEVARIQSRDFEGAAALLEATADPGLVSEYLGRDPVDPREPPEPDPGSTGEDVGDGTGEPQPPQPPQQR